MVALQRSAGNAAVARLLARSVVASGGWEGVVDELRRAIKPALTGRMEIDVEAVCSALAGLTAARGKEVEAGFNDATGWHLRDVVMGYEPLPNALSNADRKRILNLLGGTAAESADPSALDAAARARVTASAEAAATRALVAQAAQLYAALRKGKDAHEVVFALLDRGTKEERTQLERVYEQQMAIALRLDLLNHLPLARFERAQALLDGDLATAAKLAIEQQLGEKRAARARVEQSSGLFADAAAALETKVEQRADAAIEQTLGDLQERGRPDVATRALALPAASGGGRLRDEIVRQASAASRDVLDDVVNRREIDIYATRLVRLEREGRITRHDVEQTILALRGEAHRLAVVYGRAQVARLAPAVPEGRRAEAATAAARSVPQWEAAIAPSVFRQFRDRFDRAGGRSLDAVVESIGNDADRHRIRELLAGSGAILPDRDATGRVRVSAEVKTLILAVESRDIDRIRAAVAGRTKRELDDLARAYEAATGHPLRPDLLGYEARLPWLSDAAEHVAEREELLEGDTYERRPGTDDATALREQGEWVYRRVAGLHARVMDNRGWFARLNDVVGNLEHDLVQTTRRDADVAISELRLATLSSPPNLTVARKRLEDLEHARHRLERNLGAYKQATKESLNAFVDAVVLLATTVATAGTATIAGGIARELGAVAFENALRSIATTVYVKAVLKDDYSLTELRNDILGGAAGAFGGHQAAKIFDELAPILGRAASSAGVTLPAGVTTAASGAGKWLFTQEGAAITTNITTRGEATTASIEGLESGLAGHALGTAAGGFKAQPGTRRGPTPEPEPTGPRAGGEHGADHPSGVAAADEAVPLSARLFTSADKLARAAAPRPEPGWYDVICHGTASHFEVLHNGTWVRIDHRRLANFLHAQGYRGGPIRLIACETGSVTASHPIAQDLANKLGVTVRAPTEIVWIHPDGTLTVGPDQHAPTGAWRGFVPASGPPGTDPAPSAEETTTPTTRAADASAEEEAVSVAPPTKGPPGGAGGGRPAFEKLDDNDFVSLGEDDIKHGTAKSYLVLQKSTGRKFLYKPSRTDPAIDRAQAAGIAQRDYARHAKAGEIAARAFGFRTPEVRLVELHNDVGSLQEWHDGTVTLRDLRFDQPQAYKKLVASPEFARMQSDIEAFDYLINNLDRTVMEKDDNFLVELGPNGELAGFQLIDHDIVFPPTPDRLLCPGHAGPLPDRYTREMVDRMETAARDPAALRQALGHVLTPPEVDATIQRLDQIVADIAQKRAAFGDAMYVR